VKKCGNEFHLHALAKERSKPAIADLLINLRLKRLLNMVLLEINENQLAIHGFYSHSFYA